MVCHSMHFMTIQQIQINSFEACVQERDEEKKWLKGSCTISRSPVVHPGDSALYLGFIEKEAPPENKLCLFRNLKNCVVLPSTGTFMVLENSFS